MALHPAGPMGGDGPAGRPGSEWPFGQAGKDSHLRIGAAFTQARRRALHPGAQAPTRMEQAGKVSK
eukprot:4685157-Heterocapsa_arctica.AAC.1